jgi:hypothetical protein
MKMFIANCTKQAQDFFYRLPGTPSPRSQHIPIGGQIQISGTLSTPDIDAIIEQHGKYGLVSVDEVDRTKPFFGTCYSIDRPVSVDKLRRAVAHNSVVLTERGVEMRREAAIAVNQAVENASPTLEALEMSVVEEKSGDGPEHEQIAEGVRVESLGKDGKPKSSKNRRGRRGE